MTRLTKIPNPDYRSHPAYGGLFGAPKLLARLEALRKIKPYLRTNVLATLKYRRHWPPRELTEHPETFPPLVQTLFRDGVAPVRLADDDKMQLTQHTASYFAGLETRRARTPLTERVFKTNVMRIPEDEGASLYTLVQETLERAGIMPGARRYLGWPVRLKAIDIQINDATDTHWKNHFPDVGLAEPSTVYMHVDSTVRWLKCLLYMTHVTPDTGPFSYVVGSHRWNVSFVEYVARRVNDKSKLDRCDPRARQLFSALPRVLQKKAEFGNDLLESDPDTRALVAGERRFTSNDGDLIFFDPDGVHRGGMIRHEGAGGRKILQVSLMPDA